jgi:ABC-2 type transport system permease protein
LARTASFRSPLLALNGHPNALNRCPLSGVKQTSLKRERMSRFDTLVILIAAELSLLFVVQWFLAVPIAGSITLFFFGAMVYAVAVATLGILLGTMTNSMGQFGGLVAPILLIDQLLSGGVTPMESEPVWLQYLMRTISATPHFVDFSKAILYRGADFPIVWPQLAAMAAIGSVYFAFSLKRFRSVIFGD